MKSNIIIIDNRGTGFDKAIEETNKVAVYTELNHQDALRLQLCTEEMLSLARSLMSMKEASFWIENEDRRFMLHMSTQGIMDKEQREMLLSTATSTKNEAATSFLGRLRDAFESAMASMPHTSDDIPTDVMDDLVNHEIELSDPEWDKYERSTLRRLADNIEIAIRGKTVDMTVYKTFD